MKVGREKASSISTSTREEERLSEKSSRLTTGAFMNNSRDRVILVRSAQKVGYKYHKSPFIEFSSWFCDIIFGWIIFCQT